MRSNLWRKAANLAVPGLTGLVTLAATVLVASPPASASLPALAGPVPAAPRYVYVSGVVSGTVAALTITPDGSLRPVPGSPVASGLGTLSIVVAPDGRRAYAANVVSRNVSGWIVGADGALTPLPGSPYDTQMAPANLAFSPDGRQVYVTTGAAGGSVLGFDLTADGALHAQSGGAVPIGGTGGTAFVAVSPDGRHLFATSYLGGTVSTLDRAPDGSLSPGPVTRVTAGTLPIYLQVSPDGRFVFVANESSNNLSGYRVGPDGALQEVPNSPFPAGGQPHGAIISSDSRTLYVPLSSTNATAAFTIGSDGQLTAVTGSPFTTGASGDMTGSAAVSPDGRRLYVVEIGGLVAPSTVRTFAIGARGGLTALPGDPASTGVTFSDGQSLMTTPDQGPTAAFSATTAPGSRRVLLDATASSAPDGEPLSRYTWSFGDGTTLTTTRAQVRHTYRSSGARTATLRVTDAENCSLAVVFHGQSASCNHDPRAQAGLRFSVG